jgi:hypothetical protein
MSTKKKEPKKLISGKEAIRRLKKLNLIDENICAEDIRLPKDPEGRLVFVYSYSGPMLPFKPFISSMEEEKMNYTQMCEAAREGKRCRRNAWKAEELLWSDGKILIHNTSYFGEPFNQGIQGYVYVCEQVDVVAEDWFAVNE